MSSEVKEYEIPTSDPDLFYSNVRYCTIQLDLTGNDLPYEGQYVLHIIGEDNTFPLYTGFAMVDGLEESKPFTEYISENETNENYIYIQD